MPEVPVNMEAVCEAEDALLARIRGRQASMGIVGLGHVGLPLAVVFAEAGFKVLGLEIDRRKIAKLEMGLSYIHDVGSEPLSELVASGRLKATDDFARVSELDCILICVPTPLTTTREPDMSFIVQAAESLAPHVRRGQLFVLESTTYPGTTDEVFRPILERGGLKAGADFHVAYSPQRGDPGNKRFTTRTIPKIVGGHTPRCLELAQALYGTVIDKTVAVSSMRVAELAKLLENIFRCVNIALVNELKVLCDRMKLDVWEVIQAASTKPFGFMSFAPGPGLGGHCIPIDPFYLSWKARQFAFQTRFIELAGEVNAQMPHYVAHRTIEALNHQGMAADQSRVLILGVAYKKDIDDVRESPALRVISLLKEHGVRVDYHDPYVPHLHKESSFEDQMESVSLSPESISQYDVVLIVADHSAIDYGMIVANARQVVDTRNATQNVQRGRAKIVKA